MDGLLSNAELPLSPSVLRLQSTGMPETLLISWHKQKSTKGTYHLSIQGGWSYH